jgi:hypothetical protein
LETTVDVFRVVEFVLVVHLVEIGKVLKTIFPFMIQILDFTKTCNLYKIKFVK